MPVPESAYANTVPLATFVEETVKVIEPLSLTEVEVALTE